jgi:hypothetical protein
MRMYRTSTYMNVEIIPIEVEKETVMCLWYKDYPNSRSASRHSKVSQHHQYHATWEDARQSLIERAKRRREHGSEVIREAANTITALLEAKCPE